MIAAELRGVGGALTFLTRVPLGRRLAVDADDVARAGVAFPVVGAGVGAVVGALAAGLVHVLPPWLAAVLAVAAGVVLTGALHLDAIADTADALGAHTRERALEIMRDHAVGAYGAIAVVLDLLVRAGALAALAAHGDVLRIATAAGAVSRAAPVLLAAALPYARPGGLGAPLTHGSRRRAAVAAAVAVAIAAGVAGVNGAIVAAATAGVVLAVGASVRRWLGGVTGDILGACVELSELTALVVAVGLVGAR